MLTYNSSKCNAPSLTINLMQLSPFLTVFPLFRSPSALRLREPTEPLRGGTHSARA